MTKVILRMARRLHSPGTSGGHRGNRWLRCGHSWPNYQALAEFQWNVRHHLRTEHEYGERKKLRSLIGGYHGRVLEAAESVNHRLWNLAGEPGQGVLAYSLAPDFQASPPDSADPAGRATAAGGELLRELQRRSEALRGGLTTARPAAEVLADLLR